MAAVRADVSLDSTLYYLLLAEKSGYEGESKGGLEDSPPDFRDCYWAWPVVVPHLATGWIVSKTRLDKNIGIGKWKEYIQSQRNADNAALLTGLLQEGLSKKRILDGATLWWASADDS